MNHLPKFIGFFLFVLCLSVASDARAYFIQNAQHKIDASDAGGCGSVTESWGIRTNDFYMNNVYTGNTNCDQAYGDTTISVVSVTNVTIVASTTQTASTNCSLKWMGTDGASYVQAGTALTLSSGISTTTKSVVGAYGDYFAVGLGSTVGGAGKYCHVDILDIQYDGVSVMSNPNVTLLDLTANDNNNRYFTSTGGFEPQHSTTHGVCFKPTSTYIGVNRIQAFLWDNGVSGGVTNMDYRMSVHSSSNGCATTDDELAYGYPASTPQVSTTTIYLENFDLSEEVTFTSGSSYVIYTQYLGNDTATSSNLVTTRTSTTHGNDVNRHLYTTGQGTIATSSSNYYSFALVSAESPSPIPDPPFAQDSFIYSWDPVTDDYFATPTTTPFEVVYVVSPLDFDDDDNVTSFVVQYEYSHALANYQQNQLTESLGDTTFSTGTSTFSGVLSQVTATGTYNVVIRLMRTIEAPWYLFWQDDTIQTMDEERYQFVVGSSTTAEDIAKARVEWENGQISPPATTMELIQQQISDMVRELLYAPPIGYGAHIFDVLAATTTSTSTFAMTYIVPDDLPMAGYSFTLDATAGVQQALQRISDTPVDTIEGDAFDKFMTYWNTMWYIALVIWIVQQIFSMYQINLTYNPSGGEYQKTGFVRGVRSGRSKGAQSIRIDQG